MAVTYQSISTVTFASRTTADDVVITKPTGLTAGDLMVTIIRGGKDTNDITPPSGWATIVDVTPGSYSILSWWKIADASDVAASNFTFELGSTQICAAAMLRIDGTHASTPINASNGTTASNTATPTFAAGVTPSVANCLLIMALVDTNGATDPPNTISGYAIATNNPTWTERTDFQDSGNALAIATSAVRPETTATGSFSAIHDGGDTANSWRGIIIAIAPPATASSVKHLALLGVG